MFKRLLKIESQARQGQEAVGQVQTRLKSLSSNIQDAVEVARKQRAELERMRDAYKTMSMQLSQMANAAGFLWHKDADGRFLFASQEWCDFFYRDHACDLLGLNDKELVQRFWKRYPMGTFTFGDPKTCVGSDEFTIKAGKRCRFFEIGVVKTGPDDPSPPVFLQTDKTPLYDKEGAFIGIVGMAMSMTRQEYMKLKDAFRKSDKIERLCETLFYIRPEKSAMEE